MRHGDKQKTATAMEDRAALRIRAYSPSSLPSCDRELMRMTVHDGNAVSHELIARADCAVDQSVMNLI